MLDLQPSDPPAQYVGEIAYTDEGDGPLTVVAVPGLPGSGRDFRWLASALAGHFRVIRIDPPGYGASGRSGWAGMTTAQRAEVVTAVIRALGVGPVVLIGHSAGGAVVAHLAARDPGVVCACVMVSATGPTAHLARRPLQLAAQILRVPVARSLLAPAIRRLADEGLGVTLALSLHAPDDELRNTLVPVNNRWDIAEVLDAATYYARTTGRRVSVEYALIRDVNDQPWRADLLGKKLHAAFGPLVHVNLIPLNPTPGSRWDASPKPVEREFVARVRAQGVTCTVRDTRGREIAAACGQLAAEG